MVEVSAVSWQWWKESNSWQSKSQTAHVFCRSQSRDSMFSVYILIYEKVSHKLHVISGYEKVSHKLHVISGYEKVSHKLQKS